MNKKQAPDDIINSVCCELSDLRRGADLTETEKALVQTAWSILTDVQCSIIRRRRPDLFKDEASEAA